MHRYFNRFKKPLAICIGTKIFLLVFSYFAFQFFSNESISSIGQFLEIWNRWDAPHYLYLAENNYTVTPETGIGEDLFIVFLPFFPALVKVFSLLTFGNFPLSGMTVSVIGACFSSILLYEIAMDAFGEKIGLRSVLFLNIFPTSYFMISSYTESIFLALSLAFYLSLRKRMFLTSILLGFASGLTRLNAILLTILTIGTKKRESFFYTLSVLSGFLIYLLLNHSLFGNPFYFLSVLHHNWYKSLSFPWIGIKNSIDYAFQFKSFEEKLVFSQEPLYLLVTFILGCYLFLKINKSWGLYVLGSFLLFSSTSFILSTPRYIFGLFPIFIALAKLTQNKVVFIILSIYSFVFLCIFTTLFVSGHWAF